MPKKKVDSQQGLRIELQESERDMLRFYSTSAAIKNVGIGVGAVALPACIIGAGVLVAAIFDKGYDALAGDMRNHIKESQNRTEAEWAEEYQIYVTRFKEQQAAQIDPDIYTAVGNVGFLYTLFGGGPPAPDEEPLSYEEWREKTHPDRTISLVNMLGNGMGRIITFGL